MNVIKTIGLVVLVLLQSSGYSQTEPLEKDPSMLTVEEARQATKAANTGEKLNRLVEAALRAERLDLVAVYLEGTNTNGMIQDYVRTQMPASRLKERIVILILRSSPGWGWEPGRLPYGRQPISPSIDDEPFGSVIKKLLPGRSLTDEVLLSKASRAELASQLEMAIEQVSPAAKSSTQGTNPSPAPSTPTIPHATAPASPQPAMTVAETPAPAVERRAPVWPWVVGIVALIVIVAVALKRRA